jgi:hypothetical protein
MSHRDEVAMVKHLYGDPFVASYGEEKNIAPLGLSRAQKKAAAKAKAKEEKEKAKAEKKAAKAEAKTAKAETKEEAKAVSKEEKANYYISMNDNSPKSMKSHRGRVHETNNVTKKKGLKVPSFSTKGMSLNGPLFGPLLKNKHHQNTQNVPKDKKNMTFIERKIAAMLRRESQEEKNAIARKELDELRRQQNLEKEKVKKDENDALEKHMQTIHASETNGINNGLAENIKRMSIKEKKNNQNTLPFFQGLIEPAKTNPRPRPQPRVRQKTVNAPKPTVPKPRPQPRVWQKTVNALKPTGPKSRPQPRVRAKTEKEIAPKPSGPKPRPQPRVRVKPETEIAPKPRPMPVPRGKAVARGTRKNV